MKVLNHLLSNQFFRFLLVGGSAALANFGSRFFFSLFFSFFVSVALATTMGTVISFIFNKIFTFQANDERITIQIVKFAIMSVIAIFFTSFMATLAMNLFRWANIAGLFPKVLMESLAHIFAIGVTTIYNFLAMKYFSFRRLQLPLNFQKRD